MRTSTAVITILVRDRFLDVHLHAKLHGQSLFGIVNDSGNGGNILDRWTIIEYALWTPPVQYPPVLSVISGFHVHETQVGMSPTIPVFVTEVEDVLAVHSPCNLLHLPLLSWLRVEQIFLSSFGGTI
jgi:hypothetical protein